MIVSIYVCGENIYGTDRYVRTGFFRNGFSLLKFWRNIFSNKKLSLKVQSVSEIFFIYMDRSGVDHLYADHTFSD